MKARGPQTCQQCSATFDPPARGRLPLYCSARCRRDHCTRRGTCADCGKETVRCNGDALPERCKACSAIDRSNHFAGRERRAELIRLYEAGVPLREIAERMGYSGATAVGVAINRLRHNYGVDLTYRYTVDADGRRIAA